MRTKQLSKTKIEQLSPTSPSSRRKGASIQSVVATWIADGQAQGFSPKTLSEKAKTFTRITWWMEHVAQVDPTLEALTPDLIRQFLAYVRTPNPDGRFGTQRTITTRETRPGTVMAYFRMLRAFFRFCIDEGLLPAGANPMVNVKAPRVPKDQVQPFSQDQLQRLLDATAHTIAPERNRAILLTLLDTGLRVSELCSLRVGDVTSNSGELAVKGKGGKRRMIYLGTAARRALRLYLNKFRRDAEDDDPLFTGEGGIKRHSGLTDWGIRIIIRELGKNAGIEGVRCSPHTLRHSFAVNALRGGMNVYELQRLMGHSDLSVLRRYVALADSDVAKAHRMASPADRLKLR